LDDRVFYHQGQGVELLGDFVLTAKGKLGKLLMEGRR
jgi:hypothetical protein